MSNGREVAIKIVENMEENLEEILQEYQILTNHGLHPNIPMLFGIQYTGSASASDSAPSPLVCS